ncbi:MAG: KH domain-containing protein [Candidatus Aenigmarchaeota archaeon]|nr:KH domain-containing protein [Candidatus Aenigmarchaeota archaeon]
MSNDRKLVLPGDFLGEGRSGNNAFMEGNKVFSKSIGLVEEKGGVFFVIPLSGIYNPKRGDGVIGKVEEIIFSKFIIDINSPYEAVLSLAEATDEYIDLTKTDLTQYLNYDDLIFAEIISVSKTKNVQISMKDRKCRKLRGGRVVKVTPAKVPRIIGKGGSMVEMIKETTNTQIVVGQNGIVWVKGDNEDIAIEAILEVEKKSHVHGLTDKIKGMIENRMSAEKRVVVKNTEARTDSYDAKTGQHDFNGDDE